MIKIKIYGRVVNYPSKASAIADLEAAADDFRRLVDDWRDDPVARQGWQRDLDTIERIVADVHAGLYREAAA